MRGLPLRASVVVPTYQRDDLLARCLEAVCNQSLQGSEYEVIVTDDAASTATQTLVTELASKTQCRLIYVAVQGAHGPAAARNAGWRQARGELIAFTDDDCIPGRNWLAAAVDYCEKHPDVHAAWGKLVMPLPMVPTDYERDASGLSTAVFVTANCFVRRTVMEDAGGFDERFRIAWREDSDLCFTMLARGLRIVHVPEAVVVHPIRPAAWGISLVQQRKSFFDTLLRRKHPALCAEHIPPFPLSYIAIVASGVVGLLATLLGIGWLSLVAIGIGFTLTLRFVLKRLHSTSHSPRHIVEMIYTSILIPWLATYYLLLGMWYFRGVSATRSAEL